MSVSVTPWKTGGFQVTVRFRWPDRSIYRDRRVVDFQTEGQARKWGLQREREVLAAGQPKPEDVKVVDRTPKVSKWFEDFHAHKERRGLASVKDMRGRAKNWFLPFIQNKTMKSVTPDDIRAIVRHLDKCIEAWVEAEGQRGEGRLSTSTAANVWGDIVHAFDEAVRSKETKLRVLTDSPCDKVRGPETGDDREGPILYSDEIVALLTGTAIEGLDVPLYRRRVYAMAVYTMGRRSELAALLASDVDLAHGTIDIAKQVDRKDASETKKTKTKRTRTIDIEANVLPLVKLLVACPEGREGRLLRVPPSEDCAELLRKDLWTVGVRRKELHEGDATRTKIWFHHLRDTGLTHMAVRGDSPIVIQWRGGHTTFAMTQGYIDRGRVEARRIGDPLPPLPAAVVAVRSTLGDVLPQPAETAL